MISIRRAFTIAKTHTIPGELPDRRLCMFKEKKNSSSSFGVELLVFGPRVSFQKGRILLCTLFVSNDEEIEIVGDRRNRIPDEAWDQMMEAKMQEVDLTTERVMLLKILAEMDKVLGCVIEYHTDGKAKGVPFKTDASLTVLGKRKEERIISIALVKREVAKNALNRRISNKQRETTIVFLCKAGESSYSMRQRINDLIKKRRQGWGCKDWNSPENSITD